MMTEKELWKNYIAGLNSHNADELSALFTDDCTFSDSAKETLGFGSSRIVGRPELKQFFIDLFAKYPNIHADMGVQFASKTYYDVSNGEGKTLHVAGYIDMYHDCIRNMDIWFRDV